MVNDIVILVDKNTPRSKWPLGRILKTFPDPKGFVRSAIVKMRGSEVKRPVSKMCVVSQPQVKMISHLGYQPFEGLIAVLCL